MRFYGKELLATRQTPKAEDHPLSALSDCFFSIFAATLHIGGRSSIRNQRTRHAVVTGTELSRVDVDYHILAEIFQESGWKAHSALRKCIYFIWNTEELPQQ